MDRKFGAGHDILTHPRIVRFKARLPQALLADPLEAAPPRAPLNEHLIEDKKLPTSYNLTPENISKKFYGETLSPLSI